MLRTLQLLSVYFLLICIMKKLNIYLFWAARLLAAVILLQTLFFKFTGAVESVYIFSAISMEPWGRIGVGVLELIASVLLLINATVWVGAGLALGLMLGAIGMHLTLLGIEVQGDGGYLFFLAIVVSGCAGFVLWTDREKVLVFLKRIGLYST